MILVDLCERFSLIFLFATDVLIIISSFSAEEINFDINTEEIIIFLFLAHTHIV